MLDKTACMCSKTSRADNTKNVHNRPKPAVFVRTAQGLSSNQNEVSINSKSDLWRTALLHRVLWRNIITTSDDHDPQHHNVCLAFGVNIGVLCLLNFNTIVQEHLQVLGPILLLDRTVDQLDR